LSSNILHNIHTALFNHLMNLWKALRISKSLPALQLKPVLTNYVCEIDQPKAVLSGKPCSSKFGHSMRCWFCRKSRNRSCRRKELRVDSSISMTSCRCCNCSSTARGCFSTRRSCTSCAWNSPRRVALDARMPCRAKGNVWATMATVASLAVRIQPEQPRESTNPCRHRKPRSHNC
jgi:hypothetical protein